MQVKGYQSVIEVELEGPDDLSGGEFVGQIRERACSGTLLGELSTDDGSITVTSDMVSGADEGYEWLTILTLTFPDTMTGSWPDETVMDIVQTDVDPDLPLGFTLYIPWDQPVTRDL